MERYAKPFSKVSLAHFERLCEALRSFVDICTLSGYEVPLFHQAIKVNN